MRKKIPTGLLVIGSMKLFISLLLIGTAFEAFRLMHKDVEETLQQVIILMHLDPDNHFIDSAIEKISGLSQKELKAISAGTLVYAALYAVEGIGLLMGKHWAEYLVIIITGSLLPLECYEVYEKTSLLRVGVLAINLAILAYLIWRLKKDKEQAAALQKQAAGASAAAPGKAG